MRALAIVATAVLLLLAAIPRDVAEALQDFEAPKGLLGGPMEMAPTARIYASRIGLVGNRTANGHIIVERDRFVALPSSSVLSSRGGNEFRVRITYRGRTVVAPVWDVGPWNTNDDFWALDRRGAPDLPRFLPQAEAAYTLGHNGGRTLGGRQVTAPMAIDLADGLFIDDLGMIQSDWVEVTFLWLTE